MLCPALAGRTAAALVVLVPLLGALTAGQSVDPSARTASAGAWSAPRTPWGHPDLQGKWANNTATPLERPHELAGRTRLSDAEVQALRARAEELFNGDTDAAFGDSVFLAALNAAKGFTSTDVTGNYNHFWLVERDFDNRTSLIVDPADGKMPPLTEEARRREAERAAYRKLHPYDGPEDIPLSERCLTRGLPTIRAGYNSYFHVLQTPGYVVIHMEMMHDTRIVPLDGRPHVGSSVRQWLGDARGRWEGDTLVVETTNFNAKPAGTAQLRMGTSERFRLVERFTRVAPDTIHHEFTVEDPETWTRPWTAMIPWKRTADNLYEFACHEGNESMVGTLNGARIQERVN
jgi:hypothetical protein